MSFSMNAYTHALSKGAELSRSIIINLQAGDHPAAPGRCGGPTADSGTADQPPLTVTYA